MKQTAFPLALLNLLAPATVAQTTYFQQNFEAGPPVSQYVNAASPTVEQFTDIRGSVDNNIFVNIVENTLEFDRQRDVTGARGYAVRNVDFSPEPQALYIVFTFQAMAVTIGGVNAIKFYVGSGFANSPTNPSNASTYARFSIDVGDTPGTFAVNTQPVGGGGPTSAYFSGQQVLTFVVNRADSRLRYLTPAGGLEEQPIHTYDLWVGTTKVFDNIVAITPGQPLHDFKVAFEDGISRVRFDNFQIRDIAGILPVGLTYFRANVVGPHVQLTWQTSWERNASHYVVQRSRDLSTFADLTQLPARGNSAQPVTYAFTDEQPLPGTSYYRLKQVDRDGATTFSRPVDVVRQGDGPVITVLPNPANGQRITLRLSQPAADPRVQVTTLAGRALSGTLRLVSEQSAEWQPHAPLPAGLYLLSWQDGPAPRQVVRVLVH